MVVSGKGVLLEKNNGEENILGEKQFLIIHAHDEGEFIVKAESGQSLCIVTIEVPARVEYPLYRNNG